MPYSDAERSRAYQREYRRMRRASDGCTTGCTTLPADFRLRAATDVLQLLEEQVEAVRAEKKAGALEKARTIGFLASIALRAIADGNLAARIEALELILKQRNGDGRA